MANAGTKQWLGNQEALTGDYHILQPTYALAENTIGRKDENGGNGNGFSEDVSYTLNATGVHGVAHAQSFSPQATASQGIRLDDVSATLDQSKVQGVFYGLAIPINTMTMMGRPSDDLNPRMGLGIGEYGEPQNTLTKNHCHAVFHKMAVRRLMPIECERLQGFPDNYTKINDKTSDSPRYKALGNSMAVPVMKWIGERIKMVEEI